MPDYSDLIYTHAGRSTVGFVGVQSEAKISDARHVYCFGSGTPVQFGPVQGILTCAHVARAVMQEPAIGVLCFPPGPNRFQTLRVDTRTISDLICGQAPWRKVGPDIAFLRFPPNVMGRIAAKASVVDLLRHAKKANLPAVGNKWFDLVSGVVDEWTPPPSVADDRSTTHFTCLHHVGRMRRLRNIKEYDVFRFRSEPGAEFKPPKSYAGMSGGGIWRFSLQSNGTDKADFVERRLVGVAFWEFSNGTLVGHGPRTLYDMLWKQMLAKWID